MSKTEEILNHHLQSFGSGNLEELLSDYTEDSLVVTPMGAVDNLGALREMFAGMLQEFGKEGASFEMGATVISGDTALITWKAETPDNVYEFATDTFVIVDGKIHRQSFAGKITPKG